MKSKRKILFGLLCVAIGAIIIYAAPDSWTERMSTISANPQDPSAQTRLLVWEWTYNYVLAHPLGGGFDMYKINVLVHPFGAGGSRLIERSRAFHSIYFEVLGEHGWIGLGLYLGIIFCAFRSLRYAARHARGQPNLLWVADMSSALQCSLLVFLFCGAFIGVAFQPFSYDLFAVAFSLREYVRRIEHASVTVTTPNFPNLAAARS
jgi:probable O-glycosylation ligase (exosortase A-associated)